MSSEKAGEKDQGTSRVIVWPETTLNSSSKLNDAFFVEIMRHIGENTLLISGGLKTDPVTREVFNSAYFISGSGRLLRYDKQLLLPYSETSPLIDLLDAYYSAPSEFTAGRTPLCIKAPEGNVGASICFEILYPGFIRQSVKQGAQYLVNISNDSWFGDSPMPYIHLNAARLRAAENRRFLLRTSNSGISAVISPTGKIISQSRLFTKERVDGDFVKLDQLSFYAKHGNLVLFGAIIILLIGLFQMIIKND
jgi:apolipoprotein N-acyltransferase